MPTATETAPRPTPRHVLQCIDAEATARLEHYAAADAAATAQRLDQLDREWDLDRLIEAEAAVSGLLGLLLGGLSHRRWWLLPAWVSTLLVSHALSGVHPLKLMHRFGWRSGRNIELERYALKALRGDFAALAADETASKPH